MNSNEAKIRETQTHEQLISYIKWMVMSHYALLDLATYLNLL